MFTALTISIYAAIVSTLVFLWRIFEFIYERIPRIKIELGQIIEGNNHFSLVQITNHSKEKRFIEMPVFVDKKVFKDNGSTFGHVGDKTFPLGIDAGERIEFKIPYSFLTEFKNKYKLKKVKAIVEDTLGKKYKSKWTDI